MYVQKGVPRHSFNKEGAYTALDTCAIETGQKLVITTEGDGEIETTFIRTPYERGAMFDWHLSEDKERRYSLMHQQKSDGSLFLDRSVILKLGNELSYHEWDAIDGVPIHLGRIVAMCVIHPFEQNIPRVGLIDSERAGLSEVQSVYSDLSAAGIAA